MYYVYVLKSLSRNYIYVGLSGDVDARISQHNRGYEKTTKPYRPFVVVKVEAFETRVQARAREKYLKSGAGKAYLRQYLQSKT